MNVNNNSISSQTLQLLSRYRKEVTAELDEILEYWMRNTHDPVNGGFTGRIDENNQLDTGAPKGAVLNARIVWAFATAYKTTHNPRHLHLARVAFNYFTTYFMDPENGGVYWTVDAKGKSLDTKKQGYAQAFAIYACCAYYEISNNEQAKNTAVELFQLIETNSFDAEFGGYLEAFSRNWQPIRDLRLSAKDANEKKSMNTHLHILEAYTALYRIWPVEQLKTQVEKLVLNFIEHIVDESTGHLVLFFDEKWSRRSSTVSFGHDIEAAWLLQEAAEVIRDESLVADVKKITASLAAAAAEGLDTDGGLIYESEPATGHLNKEKHSWVQAEAMVGFLNQWQLTGNDAWLHKSLQSWNYVTSKIKDPQYGEWYWGRNEDGTVMAAQDKVGIWKCPYHNSRACIEIIQRLDEYLLPNLEKISGGEELSV